MSDAVETLTRQIEEWEARAEEARETLRVAEAILPSLRKALESDRGALVGAEPSDLQQSPTPPAESSSATTESAEDAPLEPVRAADEVRKVIRSALTSLPNEFGQSDVQEALEANGLTVNRSTLSFNLLEMAKAEDGFRVKAKGKGRKPTVYEQHG